MMVGFLWMFTFLGIWVLTPFLGEEIVVFREFPGRVLISLPYRFSVFAGISVVLFLAFCYVQYRGRAGRFNMINSGIKWLALIPAAGLVGLPHVPQLSTFLYIYVSPCVLAFTAVRGYCSESFGTKDRWGVDWTILLATGTILFSVLGVWVTKTVGEHGGDEGHYLIQAKSLHEDGDLDLRNNFGGAATGETPAHISLNSKNGKWYSCHFSALCFLLAPTCGFGLYARHLVLGFIAGLGIAGVYLLARWLGATRRGGWAAALLMGGSTYYGIYSCRALPEVLGGTLAVYGFIALWLQKPCPARSFWLALFCLGALPLTYIRFAPMAVALAGAYVVQCLCLPTPWRKRVLRSVVFISLILTVWILLYLNQCRMFVGGMVASIPSVLMASPQGLWYSLTSSKGILVAFPIFICAFLGTIGLLRFARYRAQVLWALLCFISIWLTSCSVPDWWGGATLPGRFLLVTVPILMGVLALVLDVAPAGFRFVAFYLGFFSINMFYFLLSVYPDLHSLFGPFVVGDFHFLLSPFPGFLPIPGEAFPWFAVGGAALLVFLWFFPKVPLALQYVLIVMTAVVLFGTRTPPNEANYSPLWTAQKWQRALPNRAFMWACGDRSRSLALLDYSNLCDNSRWPRTAREVIGGSAKQVSCEGIVSYPLIPTNGWANHPEYRWVTLMDPIPVGHHDYAIRIRAKIIGDSDVEIAIREGGLTRMTKTFKAGTNIIEEYAYTITARNRLYILMRFIEPAEHNRFIIDELKVTPYQARLAQAGNLMVGTR